MTQTTKKYFKVIAKCGHVGKNKYVPIPFAVSAQSRSEASQKALKFPRVKKQLDDAIISCEEIDKKTFKEIIKANQSNQYLKGKCNRDNCFDGFQEMIEDNVKVFYHKRKIEPAKSMKYRRERYENGGSFNCIRWCCSED